MSELQQQRRHYTWVEQLASQTDAAAAKAQRALEQVQTLSTTLSTKITQLEQGQAKIATLTTQLDDLKTENTTYKTKLYNISARRQNRNTQPDQYLIPLKKEETGLLSLTRLVPNGVTAPLVPAPIPALGSTLGRRALDKDGVFPLYKDDISTMQHEDILALMQVAGENMGIIPTDDLSVRRSKVQAWVLDC